MVTQAAPSVTDFPAADDDRAELRVSWRRPAFWDGLLFPLLGACSGALIALPLAVVFSAFWWLLVPAAVGFAVGAFFRGAS